MISLLVLVRRIFVKIELTLELSALGHSFPTKSWVEVRLLLLIVYTDTACVTMRLRLLFYMENVRVWIVILSNLLSHKASQKSETSPPPPN